ncbi:hypothetical protein EJ110_NYTH11534 [Nymphaea thermarum]|nr:hypothetical protein EJ110_NYTH11534 [Nymphaea thermarum]
MLLGGELKLRQPSVREVKGSSLQDAWYGKKHCEVNAGSSTSLRADCEEANTGKEGYGPSMDRAEHGLPPGETHQAGSGTARAMQAGHEYDRAHLPSADTAARLTKSNLPDFDGSCSPVRQNTASKGRHCSRKRLEAADPFFLLAGPNVIESEEHVLTMARRIKDITSKVGLKLVFKSSFDKANRTSSKSFRGPGLEDGLKGTRVLV